MQYLSFMRYWARGWLVVGLLCIPMAKLAAAEGNNLEPPPGAVIAASLVQEWQHKYNDNAALFASLHPKQKARFINRLVNANSPYLLRHATNPVNWQPWSSELLSQAQQQNKLIFLSIGYATCHWCHVMEQESFTNAGIAEQINKAFIAIKVDREELPEIDRFYTEALAVVKGSSGWPVTAIINGKGDPVFIDAYVSKAPLSVALERVSSAWAGNAGNLSLYAKQISEQVRRANRVTNNSNWQPQLLKELTDNLVGKLDPYNGGFSGSPKFPSAPMLLYALNSLEKNYHETLAERLETQLDAMINNGLYDHLHGGFHRYATRSDWSEPHFEKMLYDQGLLLSIYSKAYRMFNKQHYAWIVQDTVAFLQQWMRHSNGAFYSAVDADYNGVEGGFYLWSEQSLQGLLNDGPQRSFLKPYSNSNKYFLAGENKQDDKWLAVRTLLRQSQQVVPQPNIDKLQITAWNALVVMGLVDAHRYVKIPEALSLAEQAAQRLWSEHYLASDKLLYRASFNGKGDVHGSLSDYAYLAQALLSLHDVTEKSHWFNRAQQLIAVAKDRLITSDAQTTESFAKITQHGLKDSDLTAPIAQLTAAMHLINQQTERRPYRAHLKGLRNQLQQAVMTAPLDHLSAATVLSDMQYGRFDSIQYFAAGHGKAALQINDRRCELSRKLAIELDTGWHVNSATPIQSYLRPTKVDWNVKADDSLKLSYPDAKLIKMQFDDEALSVYEGKFTIQLQAPEQSWSIQQPLTLSVQTCSKKLCLPPENLKFYFPPVYCNSDDL